MMSDRGINKAEHAGGSFRNYQDDQNAPSQETLYCTSNGVPMPHPYETHRGGENCPLLFKTPI
jgi:catalase